MARSPATITKTKARPSKAKEVKNKKPERTVEDTTQKSKPQPKDTRPEARVMGVRLGYCKSFSVQKTTMIFENFVPNRPGLFNLKWPFGNNTLKADMETGEILLFADGSKTALFKINVTSAEFRTKVPGGGLVNCAIPNFDHYKEVG